jgi:hypothetical protein
MFQNFRGLGRTFFTTEHYKFISTNYIKESRETREEAEPDYYDETVSVEKSRESENPLFDNDMLFGSGDADTSDQESHVP